MERQERRTRVRYLLIVLIFGISAVAYLDRTNISVAGLPMSADYHIDRIRLGWVFSAFLLGYAGFQIPAGWLAGRYGPRLVLALGLVWWAVFSVATTLVPPAMAGSLWLLIAVRFVLGIGEAVMYPAANQFIAAWFPAAERGTANGWVFGGVGVGAGITPPIVTWVMLAYGWRSAFWLSAAVGLVAAAVWYGMARNRPEDHPAVSSAELAHIKRGQPPTPGEALPPVPWRQIFTSRTVWLLVVAYTAFGYVAFIFLTWFFIYLAQGRGLNLKSSAGYTMLPFIAMTVCCLAGGVISDWLSRVKGQYLGRSLYGAFTLILTALFVLVGSHAQSTPVAVLALAGGAGAVYLGQNCYWAVAADYAGPYTGVVSGLLNMGCQIAGAVTASLTPYLAERFGWSAAFYTAAAIAFLCAFAWLGVEPGHRLQSR